MPQKLYELLDGLMGGPIVGRRLRAKFQVAGLPMTVESVRGYGFRARLRPHVEAASEEGNLVGA